METTVTDPRLQYRVESSKAIHGMLWPRGAERQMFMSNRELAVAVAAKSETEAGAEIRVVHVPSGEVVFRKPGPKAVTSLVPA
jgi:hypothetical protein